MLKPRKKVNYVNNADFLAALKVYLDDCNAAEAAGKQIPNVPKYVGECIQAIATRLATKGNFSGYSYRDDMVMDGIENSLKYIRNFNPDKFSNPFAYFSRIIWFAFLRRIKKEKKELYIKYKASYSALNPGVDNYATYDYIDTYIRDYEEKLNAKKKGPEKEGPDIEDFLAAEDTDR